MNRVRLWAAVALTAAATAASLWSLGVLAPDPAPRPAPARPAADVPPPALPVQTVVRLRPRPPAQVLSVRRSDRLDADLLVDRAGRTVYRSDRDSWSPPASSCSGPCARTWRPVPAAGRVRLVGVRPELVGSLTRADGTRQLTVSGWPVYTFSGDARPGDTRGHCVDGFSAVTGTGEPAMAVRSW